MRSTKKKLDRNKLTVGIGSGCGEHELLFFLEGYKVIASDAIPGLSEKLSGLFFGFQAVTIDIFKDNIPNTLECTLNLKNTNYDVLVTGLDSYFDDIQAQEMFYKLSENLKSGAQLIFTIRYPDSVFRRCIEYWLYLEARINNTIRKRGILQKHHGYRRSIRDVRILADNAGFIFRDVEPAMFGCECSRSRIIGKLYPVCRALDQIIPLFNCAFVVRFEKR